MVFYEAAKARMWSHRKETDVAIGCASDPVVMRCLTAVGGRTRTFGMVDADYHVAERSGEQWLVGPMVDIAPVSLLPRRLPHDLTNTLAAAALVLESGLADVQSIRAALPTFRHPPHRIEPLGTIDGVEWFNDSKATTPHATLTALRGFDRVVLLAGGRNKGLDLSSLAMERRRVVAAVGLGESAAEIVEVFGTTCPTRIATSMAEAVTIAAELAEPGDAVLLSPACASFDWYPDGGYPARGNDFKGLVADLARHSNERSDKG